MRVLQVITSLITGGAEKLVVDLIFRLRAKGIETDIVLFDGENTDLKMKLEKSGCRIYSLSRQRSFYNPLCVLKLIRLMQHYDIVHSHNSSPQLFVMLANMFCHKIIVTTEHNTHNRKRQRALLRKIDWWMYSKYDKIICISDKVEENLRQYLSLSATAYKIEIEKVYNGVNISLYHDAKPRHELREGFLGTIIVMVAAFRQQKDQATLVKAMSFLPRDHYRLWLVGEGETLEKIRSLSKFYNLESSVFFLGNRNDVPVILKTADIVVMSSYYEGLSLSSIEGMAAGKPFIASDVDGLHEITKGAGILVPPHNPEALAVAIRKLGEDEDYYDAIARSSYERAKAYDITKTAEAYGHIYTNLFSAQCS